MFAALQSRFIVAVAASLAAAGVRYACFAWLGIRTPLLMLHVAAVAFVSQYLGTAPGLAATGASFALIVHQLSPVPDPVTMAVFAAVGASLSVFGGIRLRTAREARRVSYNLETAQQIANIGSWESDTRGQVWWSPETYRIFGVDPGAPIRREDFFALVHPEDRARVQLAVKQAVETRGDYDIEHRILRKSDGELRFVHQRGKLLENGVTRLVGSIQDVTEVRRTSRELQRAQQRLALKHEIARMGTFDWFVAEDRIVWSPEMEILYGVSSETHEHTFDEWKALVHPDDLPSALEAIRDTVDRRQSVLDSTYRIVRRDGSHLWLHSRCKFEYGPDGRPVHALGLNIDVTEMKRAADEVERVNRTVALAMEAGNSGASTWNIETGELTWTDAYCRVLGIDPAKKPSQELFYERIHPDDAARVRREIEDALQGRTTELRMEFRIVRPDGVRWIERRGRVFFNADGKPAQLVGISADVTERRVLRGLLTTCAECKKIRDERNQWQALEQYISGHSAARFSHGFCPECADRWFQSEGLNDSHGAQTRSAGG